MSKFLEMFAELFVIITVIGFLMNQSVKEIASRGDDYE